MKYPPENILDPRRHNGTRPTKPKMVQNPGNLAHTFQLIATRNFAKN